MKNRDDLNWQALGDLMLTICECRFKKCPIEIVGERKPECVPTPEGLAQTDCEGCIQDWLNGEVET